MEAYPLTKVYTIRGLYNFNFRKLNVSTKTQPTISENENGGYHLKCPSCSSSHYGVRLGI